MNKYFDITKYMSLNVFLIMYSGFSIAEKFCEMWRDELPQCGPQATRIMLENGSFINETLNNLQSLTYKYNQSV